MLSSTLLWCSLGFNFTQLILETFINSGLCTVMSESDKGNFSQHPYIIWDMLIVKIMQLSTYVISFAAVLGDIHEHMPSPKQICQENMALLTL